MYAGRMMTLPFEEIIRGRDQQATNAMDILDLAASDEDCSDDELRSVKAEDSSLKREREASDEVMSYEQERLKNIQDNAALMNSLGLSDFKPTASSISRPAPKPVVIKKSARNVRKVIKVQAEPTRRSGRISAISVDHSESKRPRLSSPSGSSTPDTGPKIKPLPPRASRQVPSIALSPSSLLKRAPIPTRRTDGTDTLEFEPPYFGVFTPNVTPKEMFSGGAFGGAFFRDTYSNVLKRPLVASQDIPEGWSEDPDLAGKLAEDDIDEERNRFRTLAGSSLEDWEKSGWIWAGDPRGWAQWYCRFYEGRRTEDDERQIKRWLQICGPRGRFLTTLLKKINGAGPSGVDDEDVGRKIRQVVWQWGFKVNKAVWQEALNGR